MAKTLYVSICESENEILGSSAGLKCDEQGNPQLVFVSGDGTIGERIEADRLIREALEALNKWTNGKETEDGETPRY